MTEQDNIQFSKRVLEEGLISQDQLLECIFDLAGDTKTTRDVRSLETLLLQRGLISPQAASRLKSGSSSAEAAGSSAASAASA